MEKQALMSASQLERLSKEEDLDHFDALNDDCIYEIFEYLSLDELCAVSATCKRVQELADAQFGRRYPELMSTSLNILWTNGAAEFNNTSKYLNYFSRKIEIVKIYPTHIHDEFNEDLLEFLRSNCSENIKEIWFNGLNWSYEFQQGIKEFLSNVEVIKFIGREQASNIRLNDFLGELPRLTHLSIEGFSPLVYQVNRLRTVKLETFECAVAYPNWVAASFKDFFEQNPTIKRFKIATDCRAPEYLKLMLKAVTQSESIEELFITVMGGMDVSAVLDQFELLDERPNFKHLALAVDSNMSGQNLIKLASLKKFSELHSSGNYSVLRGPVLRSLIHLKVLLLDKYYVHVENAENLGIDAKNLDTLIISDAGPLNFRCFMYSGVFYAAKLTEIVLRPHRFEAPHLDLDILNQARSRLAGASKMVIRVEQAKGRNVIGKSGAIESSNDLVTVSTN